MVDSDIFIDMQQYHTSLDTSNIELDTSGIKPYMSCKLRELLI